MSGRRTNSQIDVLHWRVQTCLEESNEVYLKLLTLSKLPFSSDVCAKLISKEWTVPCCRSICCELSILGIRKSWLSLVRRQSKGSTAWLNSWTGLSHARWHLPGQCYCWQEFVLDFVGFNTPFFHGCALQGINQEHNCKILSGLHTQMAHEMFTLKGHKSCVVHYPVFEKFHFFLSHRGNM